jgi:hypothetical protein
MDSKYKIGDCFIDKVSTGYIGDMGIIVIVERKEALETGYRLIWKSSVGNDTVYYDAFLDKCELLNKDDYRTKEFLNYLMVNNL